MTQPNFDWDELEVLASRLSGVGPGSASNAEWKAIEQSMGQLLAVEDWTGIIRLREMFTFLVQGETTGGMAIVQRVNEAATQAAVRLGNEKLAARYLRDSGENYHRRGYHQKAIDALEHAAALYRKEGERFKSLESYYMMALPYRALGEHTRARAILDQVLQETARDDSWRANPLQVVSWMMRDAGQFSEAEAVLREALELYRQHEGEESIHAVQTLTDLGEVIGLQGRFLEAVAMFERSLEMVEMFGGQYDRQEARTKLRYAEMLIRLKDCDKALQLLNEADDKIRGYGHYYDLLGGIELAKAFAFLGKGEIRSAIRKLRVLLRYRKEIDLPYSNFAQQFLKRLRWAFANRNKMKQRGR